jgi:hypothetical protein
METKTRADRGPRITDRDIEALVWIVQQYAICLDHLCILLTRLMDYTDYAQKPNDPGALTKKRTTKIVRHWERLGLIERGWILQGDPMWVWLTPEGLRLMNEELGKLRYYRPTPAKINHLYWCNHARLYIEQKRKDTEWRSERQVRANQKSESGVKRPHTPDAILNSNGHEIAIEVELSTKTYHRLDTILEELAESNYHTVWYFCLGRAKKVVETAIENRSSSDTHHFVVYDIEECELE